MRALLGICLVVALTVGNAGKAFSQGPVEYLVILVLSVDATAGPEVIGVHPSSAVEEGLCGEEPSPDAQALCDSLAGVEHRMPGAQALSKFFGAGLNDFIATPLPPAHARKRVSVITEQSEDGVPGGDFHFRFTVSPGSFERIVVHSMAGDDTLTVDFVNCNFPPRGHELTHVQQQGGDTDATSASSHETQVAESCVDALQDGLFDGMTLAAVTPLASTPHNLGRVKLDADLNEAQARGRDWVFLDSTSEVAFYLILSGPPLTAQ